jgi:hypothetical protein
MIWLPDGWSQLKISLERNQKIERIKRITKQIKNIELVVEFEYEKK